jgi:hypothetical protein
VRDPEQARRLEAIVHADDVDLHGRVRRIVADEVGKVDDAFRLGCVHRGHDFVELSDISAYGGHLSAEIGKRVRTGIRIGSRRS